MNIIQLIYEHLKEKHPEVTHNLEGGFGTIMIHTGIEDTACEHEIQITAGDVTDAKIEEFINIRLTNEYRLTVSITEEQQPADRHFRFTKDIANIDIRDPNALKLLDAIIKNPSSYPR